MDKERILVVANRVQQMLNKGNTPWDVAEDPTFKVKHFYPEERSCDCTDDEYAIEFEDGFTLDVFRPDGGNGWNVHSDIWIAETEDYINLNEL